MIEITIGNPMLYNSIDVAYHATLEGFHVLGQDQTFISCDPVIEVRQGMTEVNMNSSIELENRLYFDFYQVTGNGSFCVKILQAKPVNIMTEVGISVCFETPDPTQSTLIKSMYVAEKRICTLDWRDLSSAKKIQRHVNQMLPVWIRVTREDSQLCSEVSDNGEDWTVIYKAFECPTDEIYIGTYYEPGSFTYYNWFYSNYIQLHCDSSMGELNEMQDVELDFFTGQKIRGNYLINNPYLFTEVMDRCDLLKMVPFREFVMESINNNYYVQALFNEKFIPGRWSYQKWDFNHVNLIYGYDICKEVYHVFGYDDKYIVSASEVPFALIEQSINSGMPQKINEDYIYRITLASPEKDFKFNPKLMISFLKEYLTSKNSFDRCSFITVPMERTFGISVYQCIINSFEFVLHNSRVFYSLYEHKFIMLKRIEFLRTNGWIQPNDFNQIYYTYKDIVQKAQQVLLIILKGNIKSECQVGDEKKKKMIQLLEKMEELEKATIPLLINSVERILGHELQSKKDLSG